MKCLLSIINPHGQYSVTCSLVRSCSSFSKRWCGGNAIGFICRDFLSCWLVFQNQHCPEVQERYALQPTLYLGGLLWNFCPTAVRALWSACVYHPQRQMASLSCWTNFVAMKVLLSSNAAKKIHPLNPWWSVSCGEWWNTNILQRSELCALWGKRGGSRFAKRTRNLQFSYSTSKVQ